MDAFFTNASAGDLSLPANSGAVDIGTPVGNLSDLALANGADSSNGGYYGAGPDLGAIEYAPPSGAKEELMMMGLGV